MTPPTFKHLETILYPSGVYECAINRPQVYNALNDEVYTEWKDAILWAAQDDRVKVFLLTGRGKFYSSGQELKRPDYTDSPAENMDSSPLKLLVTALIDFPKPLIAAVNGPAYGFAVTSLALCDLVYATPDSTFTTPFMKLGFAAEACSSYTFPKIMGNTMANEMLLMGRTMTIDDMVGCGFVSRIIPKDQIGQETLKIAEEATHYSVDAIKVTKALIRDVDRASLHKINDDEMNKVATRIRSPESIAAVNAFVDLSEKRRAERKAGKSKI
ncbi:ClpP/crotonase-like domain-containing protein [Chlamydoabsidia padenii]|nr:ClpP/crotonase-like domain-containing protein [Chlamydoabsidia padenii]